MTRTQIKASLKLWTKRATAARKDWHDAKASEKRRTTAASKARAHADRVKAYVKLVAAKKLVALRTRQLKAATPLRLRALAEGRKQVGVEEVGHNRGAAVDAIVRYANGDLGEPYCVDGMIWCYGHAGSRAVRPGYPRAVRLMLQPGVVKTSNPQPGNLVRFVFDHTGMFVKDLGNGTIRTLEFNTGTGDVSDPSGGGVFYRTRDKSLVQDYLRVTC